MASRSGKMRTSWDAGVCARGGLRSANGCRQRLLRAAWGPPPRYRGIREGHRIASELGTSDTVGGSGAVARESAARGRGPRARQRVMGVAVTSAQNHARARAPTGAAARRSTASSARRARGESPPARNRGPCHDRPRPCARRDRAPRGTTPWHHACSRCGPARGGPATQPAARPSPRRRVPARRSCRGGGGHAGAVRTGRRHTRSRRPTARRPA